MWWNWIIQWRWSRIFVQNRKYAAFEQCISLVGFECKRFDYIFSHSYAVLINPLWYRIFYNTLYLLVSNAVCTCICWLSIWYLGEKNQSVLARCKAENYRPILLATQHCAWQSLPPLCVSIISTLNWILRRRRKKRRYILESETM